MSYRFYPKKTISAAQMTILKHSPVWIRKSILPFLLSVACLGSRQPVFADIITLKSGKVLEATIVERAQDSIVVDIQGVRIRYYTDQIQNIQDKAQPSPASADGTPLAQIKQAKEVFALVSPAVVFISYKSALTQDEPFGSGFIVDSNGYIITNYHVIVPNQYSAPKPEEIIVTFKNGQTCTVENIAYQDPQIDICLLKIGINNLPTIALGDSDSLQIGETVYTIGSPLGLDYTFSNGILSAIRESRI